MRSNYLLIALTLFLVLSFRVAYSEETCGFIPEPLPKERQETFVSRLFEDLYMEWKATPTPTNVPDAWREPFSGNRPYLSANLSKAILRFKLPEVNPVRPKSVEIEIGFSEKGISLKHSLPRSAGGGTGVIFSTERPKARRAFIDGAGRSGFVAMVPNGSDPKLQTVLLCPRDLPTAAVDGGISLIETGYILDGISTSFEGSISGRVLTGAATGVAKGRFLSSSLVPPTTPCLDESSSKDPSVDVIYRRKENPIVTIDGDPEHVEAGVRGEVDLLLTTGISRRTWLDHVLYINRLTIQSFNFTIPARFLQNSIYSDLLPDRARAPKTTLGLEATSVKGRCYALIYDKGTITHDFKG